VKVADREAADRLHQLGDDFGEFWSDLPGRHADLMISPNHLASVSESLATNGFEFSTLVENVAGDVLENISINRLVEITRKSVGF